MGMSMKDSGEMIRLMVLVITDMPTELLIMGSGRMISNMVRVLRPGLMEQDMRAPIMKAKSMEKALCNLQTVLCILVTFSKMRLAARVFTSGQMARLTMEVGRRTRCMEWVL